MSTDIKNASPLRCAVLISGGGRTLKNLLDYKSSGRLKNVCFPLVVSSSPTAAGLQYAALCNADAQVVERKEFDSDDAFSDAIYDLIEQSQCNFIVMAGFMRKLIIRPEWENKAVNIHPSLIPSFCGPGFYGKKVHQAAIDYGVKVSGCTVHFVTNEVDGGPIILQKTVSVHSDDDADSLAARVLEVEFQALPEALELIADGRVTVVGRKTVIMD
ncbi:MAG: phosphoribosylglycinamide formyltransferase [Thermoguttaceae bacterium]|nr:phosphoribosylglycinamide formyltransferase [Thermoguttaceae bacterium]